MSRLSDKRLRSHVLQVFQHHSSHGSRKPVALTWWNSAKQSRVHSQWQKLSGRLLTPGKAISDFSSEHFLQRCKVNAYTHALPTHKNSDSYGTILRLHTSMTFSSFFFFSSFFTVQVCQWQQRMRSTLSAFWTTHSAWLALIMVRQVKSLSGKSGSLT